MFYPRFLDVAPDPNVGVPKPTLTFSLAFLLLSLLFWGCQREPKKPGELVFSLASDPISLDPIQSTDLSSRIVLKYLTRKLFETDSEGKILPSLVSKYSIANGKLPNTRTLVLEFNRNSSTSVPVYAETVLQSLERLRTVQGPKRSAYSFLKGGRVLSQFSLELYFEGGLREALEKLSLPQAWILCEPPEKACGEFRLSEWKRNNFIRIVSNGETSSAKEILFRILPQASTGLFLYSKGELDWMKLPNFLLRNSVVKEEDISVRKGGGVQYVAINSGDPCFDKNFRKALNYAVDKRLIIKVLLEGKGEVAVGPFPGSVSSSLGRTEEFYPYDADLAKEYLIKSSCYPAILERVLDFRMRGDEENQANGAAIVENLRELGLKIKINPMEKAALYKENGERKGDLTLLFWYADFPGPWAFLDPLFAGDRFGNAGNRAFFSHPEMERIFKEVRSTDKIDTKENAKRALLVLGEEAPWIFLWSPYELYLTGKELNLQINRRLDPN